MKIRPGCKCVCWGTRRVTWEQTGRRAGKTDGQRGGTETDGGKEEEEREIA